MLCFMMLVSPPLPFAIMPFAAPPLLNVCRCYMPFLQKLPGQPRAARRPRSPFLRGTHPCQPPRRTPSSALAPPHARAHECLPAPQASSIG